MKEINPWLALPASLVVVGALWLLFSFTQVAPTPAFQISGSDGFQCLAFMGGMIALGLLIYIADTLRRIRRCMENEARS